MDSTTICNLALAKIGDLSIMSLDDPTPEARFSKLFYAPTCQELFRAHNWNWATSFSRLSPIATPPEIGWDCAYALPTDFGRMLIFNSFASRTPTEVYQIVGNQIYTDETYAEISYIRLINDESLFDPMFVECLALKLGSKFARPLAGSLDIEKTLLSEYNRQLNEARRIDASEGVARRKPLFIDSQLVQSRYTGTV